MPRPLTVDMAALPGVVTGQVTLEVAERFREKVLIEDAPRNGTGTPCWAWQASTGDRGRPAIKVLGRRWWAYRLAWLLWKGVYPHGRDIHHRCHFEGCVNPDHLLDAPSKEEHGRWSANRQWNNGGPTGDEPPDPNALPY